MVCRHPGAPPAVLALSAAIAERLISPAEQLSEAIGIHRVVLRRPELWELHFFPPRVIWDDQDPADPHGFDACPAFQVDVQGLLQIFDSVKFCDWCSSGCATFPEAAHMSIRGNYSGIEAVCRIFEKAPVHHPVAAVLDDEDGFSIDEDVVEDTTYIV